jgi:hypothetical protein
VWRPGHGLVLQRLNGGRATSAYPAPAMLLTATGAKTGLVPSPGMVWLLSDWRLRPTLIGFSAQAPWRWRRAHDGLMRSC